MGRGRLYAPPRRMSVPPIVRCTRCHQAYPAEGVPFLCAACGGIYDFDAPFLFNPDAIDLNAPGIWRYRSGFGLPEDAPAISLGEGNTPLIAMQSNGCEAWLKLDSLNPTGSYKDRGSATLLSFLRLHGVQRALEDSSGNAGASFAAYAARAGVAARVFVPEAAAGPKRRQIELYGADLVQVAGARSAAAEAALEEAKRGVAYASHAYLPFGLPGIATLAYELYAQMGSAPGTVVAPVGHGGLLLGIVRGFAALQAAGVIQQQPYYVGVQAARCAPLWLGFTQGIEAMGGVQEGQTVAEGVRVRVPMRAEAIIREILPQSGTMVAIEEERILPAYADLAARGVYVEPTSALVWAAYGAMAETLPQPVVMVISGAGLKYYPQQ